MIRPADVLADVARDGWAIVDLLDADGVAAAQRVVDDADLDPDHPFFASPAVAWGPVARSIDQRLKEIVVPRAADLLPDHRPFMAGITSKGAHSDATIFMHQDWTYTDEARWPVVFLWCPLVDVDETNGGLAVVPGSHRWTRDVRPSREWEPSDRLQPALRSRAVPVALRAGQAVAFDPATFHGSGPNRTARPRPAFTMAFAPVGAELLHFHEDPAGTLTGHRVDEAFFTEHPYRSRPDAYERVEPPGPALTRERLAAALGVEPEPQPEPAPVAAPAAPAPEPSVQPAAPSRLAALAPRVVAALMALDERLIDRFDPAPTGPVDLERLPWRHELERRWPEIRRELDALIEAGVRFPTTDALAGADQGADGTWTSYVLHWFGHRIDVNADRLPVTSALVAAVPGVQIAGYTVLHPHTHLPRHQGPAKSLRYQLGVRVPGPDGANRLCVGGETIVWSDRTSLAFDDRTMHEVWNDADDTRYVLFVQVAWPVGGWVGVVHRACARAFGRLTRGISERAADLDRTLNATTGPTNVSRRGGG